MQAVVIGTTGGPEVLEWSEAPDPVCANDGVVVEVAAAGVNFIDTYHRTGLYPMEMPFTPGLEGAGTVVEVGPDVTRHVVGERVAWTGSIGSYAQRVAMHADSAVKVPPSVDFDVAAAVMLQGCTAHYLVNDTFPLAPGHKCLVHAGAGGVGRLLIQLAKQRDAEVFATVGTGAKAALAKSAGADHVINYVDKNFKDAVEEIAGPKAINVVYDGVGAATFDDGLDLLAPLGMMVPFGNASGPVPPVDPLRLSNGGSLFLTRPRLFDYIGSPLALRARTADLFGWIADGSLDVLVGRKFPMSEAKDAHIALEGRQTTGKVLLVP